MATDTVSFSDPEVQKCPFSAYRKVRAQGPVYVDPKTGFYVVTDYALLRQCADDAATFSSQTGLILVKDSPIKAELDADRKLTSGRKCALLAKLPPELPPSGTGPRPLRCYASARPCTR